MIEPQDDCFGRVRQKKSETSHPGFFALTLLFYHKRLIRSIMSDAKVMYIILFVNSFVDILDKTICFFTETE
jgi:hypothetical protein